jgi:hypothetical protein
MRNLLPILILLLSVELSAQDYYEEKSSRIPVAQETTCITVGILHGGGSLIGADLEFLLSPRFGAQVGMGLVGFGGGLNYHFKPGVRSSMLSVQYYNQGIGDNFAQSMVGPSFVYRSQKWFTFSVGLAGILEVGDMEIYDEGEQPSVLLTYAIGAYFPW